MADSLVGLDSGGCVAALANGAVGQVMTIGSDGKPAWINSADDQTASEVSFTPYGVIASTSVQAAVQEILDEFCTILGGCSVNALADVDTATAVPTADQSGLFWNGANWVPDTPTKFVSNPGTLPPIVAVADAGNQPLWNVGLTDVSVVSNDIIPVISSTGERHWYIRRKGAYAKGHDAQVIQPGVVIPVIYTTVLAADGFVLYNNGTGEFTVPVDGWVSLVGTVHCANGSAVDVNAASDYRINIGLAVLGHTFRFMHYPNQANGNVLSFAAEGYVTAGSVIYVAIFHNAASAFSLVADAETRISLTYTGG